MKKTMLAKEMRKELENIGLEFKKNEDSLKVMNAVFETIARLADEGEKVSTSIGTFEKKHINERHNKERVSTLPATKGQIIHASVTPAKDVLGFKTKIEY